MESIPKTLAVLPPTEEILAVCALIERFQSAHLAAKRRTKVKLGTFESELEAYNSLHWLTIRHTESVITLARSDLVTLPAANVVARAAFEVSLKILWMLSPGDPFAREVRWLLHLRTAIEHYGKLQSSEHIDETRRGTLKANFIRAETVAIVIEKKLNERGYIVPNKKVSVWDMLKDLNQKHLYTTYIELSAYTHTNFEAGSLFRDGILGPRMNEYTSQQHWVLPLETSWRSLHAMSDCILSLMKSPIDSRSAKQFKHDFKRAIKALKN